MISLALTLAFTLSGCGEEAPESNLGAYDAGSYTINTNPAWTTLTEADFYPGIPEEAKLAFVAPEAYNGFYLNVSVTEEGLDSALSSVDFGRSNISLAARNLTDYEKIQEASVDLGGESALVHIFQARLNPTEKLLRFIQLYATQGQTGYTITGAMPIDTPENLRDEVGAMVTSFLKK